MDKFDLAEAGVLIHIDRVLDDLKHHLSNDVNIVGDIIFEILLISDSDNRSSEIN